MEADKSFTDAEIISRFDDWFSDADRISIAGRVLQVIDLTIFPGSKDEVLFEMALEFFKSLNFSETRALQFLRDLFLHEGHGEALPPEHAQNIIKLWPQFKL